jgi:DNA repair protein RadC
VPPPQSWFITITPSGDPSPSEADIKVKRDLIPARQLLKFEVLDHEVVGFQENHGSFRSLGFFA